MKTIMTLTALSLAAACTPAPQVCERTVGMSKGGIPIMLGEPCVIAPPTVAKPIGWDHNDGSSPEKADPDVSPPTTPEDPTSDPEGPENEPEDDPKDDKPKDDNSGGPKNEPKGDKPKDDNSGGPKNEPKDDKPKGDNSDANGKGGNKHDRDDFTHGGTEVAEGKKGR